MIRVGKSIRHIWVKVDMFVCSSMVGHSIIRETHWSWSDRYRIEDSLTRDDCTICVAKTKALNSCIVIANAKCRFSHEAAQM